MKMRPQVCANQYISILFSNHFLAPEASQPEPATGDPTHGPDEGNEAEDAEEGEGPKVLSKKEKERLKKEKEKVNFIWLCVSLTA